MTESKKGREGEKESTFIYYILNMCTDECVIHSYMYMYIYMHSTQGQK